MSGEPKSVEAMVAMMPHLAKISILGRIAPPLKHAIVQSADLVPRGAIIVVEGDDQVAVKELAAWLGDYLGRKTEYCVRVAQGPKLPSGGTATIQDYLQLMLDWHDKGKKMIDFITNPPNAPPSQSSTTEPKDTQEDTSMVIDTPPRIPLIVLERYQIYASDTFAAKIAIKDNYSPVDHWQWMATMWRDIVGPNITVYLKDTPAEEISPGLKMVEVKEDVKCVTVVKKMGAKTEDKELRRLAFEIGELVGAMQGEKEKAAVEVETSVVGS